MRRARRIALPLLFACSILASPAPAAAHPGTGIAVDAAGRVYFTDLKQIWRCDPDGRLTVVVPGRHSHGIRLSPDGTLWGEHLSYDGSRWWSSAWKLPPGGTRLEVSSPEEEGFPFLFPAAVAPDGTRYFARVDNNRRDRSEIFRQRPGDVPEPFAGGTYGYADGSGAAARFGPIGAIAVGLDGTLFVTDAPAVRKVSPDGRVSTLARGGRLLKATLAGRLFGDRSGTLMGAAVDASGNVSVANYGGRRVVRISPSGAVSSVLESGVPWAPSGVALAGGALYVLEYGAWPGSGMSVRVRRLGADGRITVLATIRGGRGKPGSARYLEGPLRSGERRPPERVCDRRREKSRIRGPVPGSRLRAES